MDIPKVKRNIGRMIDGGASETEIDEYISSEGVTMDMLKPQSMIPFKGALEPSTLTDDQIRFMGDVPSYPEKMIRRGMLDAWEGMKQFGLEVGGDTGLLPTDAAANYTAEAQAGRDKYQQEYGNLPNAEANRLIGNVAPYAPIPAVGGPTVAGRVAGNALMGTAIGGTQFIPEGGSRVDSAQKGAMAGAAIPLVGEGLSRGAGKLFNRLPDEAADIYKLGKQHEVPVYAPDVSANPMMEKTAVATEYVPFVGMGNSRKVQNKAAQLSAEELTGRYSKAGDWTERVQAGMKNKARVVKLIAGKKYDKVSDLADPLGPQQPLAMNAKAKEFLDIELSKPVEYQDATKIKMLTKYSTDPNANFSGLRQIRSELGDDIADMGVGNKETRVLVSLKQELEKDLNRIGENPKIQDSWKKADTYYRTKVVPMQDRTINRAMKTDTPDETYGKFIMRGKKDRALKFYNALDNNGRQAVRQGILEDAYEKATAENRPFSPAKFAGQMERLQKATGVFFKGEDKAMVDGFAKLMRHVERSGAYMENQPTGQRVIPYLVGGAAYAVEPGMAVAGASSTFLLKKLFTSEFGKKILLTASKLEYTDPAMKPIVDNMESYLSRIVATANSRQDQTRAQEIE